MKGKRHAKWRIPVRRRGLASVTRPLRALPGAGRGRDCRGHVTVADGRRPETRGVNRPAAPCAGHGTPRREPVRGALPGEGRRCPPFRGAYRLKPQPTGSEKERSRIWRTPNERKSSSSECDVYRSVDWNGKGDAVQVGFVGWGSRCRGATFAPGRAGRYAGHAVTPSLATRPRFSRRLRVGLADHSRHRDGVL